MLAARYYPVAGPIGILSALYADAMGAGSITIVEPNPNVPD